MPFHETGGKTRRRAGEVVNLEQLEIWAYLTLTLDDTPSHEDGLLHSPTSEELGIQVLQRSSG